MRDGKLQKQNFNLYIKLCCSKLNFYLTILNKLMSPHKLKNVKLIFLPFELDK